MEAILSLDLGSAESIEPADVRWVAESHFAPSRITGLRGRADTQPVLVAYASSDAVEESLVQIGVGKPAEVLDLQPDCGCDACDTGSADLLESLDAAFILALSGGVYVVREGDRVVTRTPGGWRSLGGFDRDEPQQWLDDAATGRRTEGVVAGEPWI